MIVEWVHTIPYDPKAAALEALYIPFGKKKTNSGIEKKDLAKKVSVYWVKKLLLETKEG